VDDFPNLQANNSTVNDVVYASVLLVTIELTQLLDNVCDILYPSTSRTLGMIRMGDYIRCRRLSQDPAGLAWELVNAGSETQNQTQFGSDV
jgi:hypothetical protein